MKSTSEIKIRKGVPLPPKGSSGTRYPWADMRVGDSVVLTGQDAVGVSAKVATWSRANGGKRRFATRKVEGGVGVWRIK